MSEPPRPVDGRQPIGPAAAALAVLLAALWGGTPVAVKFSLDQLDVMAIAAVRFGMAAAFMLVWCRLEGSGLKLRSEQVLPSLVTGLLLFVQIGLFNTAIRLSNASHSTLLINTFIFWVAMIEHFITRTGRLTLQKWAGLAIAFAGVAVMMLTAKSTGATGSELPVPPDSTASLAGDLLMLASAILLGIKIIYTKQAMTVVEPGKLIFWHDVIGVACFAAWSLLFEDSDLSPFLSAAVFTEPAVRNAMLGLLYQGVVVAGFCFATQALLLRKHSASQLSAFSFATPLFGVAYAVLLRGDPLSGWLAVAGVAVAAGIVLVNRRERNDSREFP